MNGVAIATTAASIALVTNAGSYLGMSLNGSAGGTTVIVKNSAGSILDIVVAAATQYISSNPGVIAAVGGLSATISGTGTYVLYYGG